MEPETIRTWMLNGLPVLGSTARYECAMCKHSFDIRGHWHVLVLALALGVLLYSLPRIQRESAITQAFAYLIMLYIAYALAENGWNRVKNPVAHKSDE